MTKTNFQVCMTELSDAIERATRTDGATFYRLKDNCDAWVTSDLMRTLHESVDDRMPCDWIYESIAGIAAAFATDYESEDADDAQEDSCEIAISQTDSNYHDLAMWLASHNSNFGFVDEALAEGVADASESIADRIQKGQYIALQRLCGAIIHAVQEQAEYRDEQAAEQEVAQ